MSDSKDISYYCVSDGSYFKEGTLIFIQANEWHILTEVVNGCYEEEVDGWNIIEMGYIEENIDESGDGFEFLLN